MIPKKYLKITAIKYIIFCFCWYKYC